MPLGRQLAQIRPANTTAATAFTADSNTEVTSVIVCNTSGANATFRLFADIDGTTMTEATALFYDKLVLADDTFIFESGFSSDSVSIPNGGSMGVRTSVNSALTFSIYGHSVS
jgi:hypothetical protein